MPPTCKPPCPPTLPPTQWTDDNSHLLHLKHPFHSNCIFHPSCPHTLTGHLCPQGSTKGPRRARATQGGLQQTPSRLSQNRGLTALCPQVDCPLGDLDPASSGSQGSLTSQLSASGLPCTFPPTPSANARIPGSPFNQESAPTTRERKQRGGCTEFTVKLELLPTGALLTVPAHGEGAAWGKVCS
jgi:hypothetical protein